MKKSLILGVLGLAAGVASSYGQGFVALDNYSSSAQPRVVYGPTGGGLLNDPIVGPQWTIGLYFAPGTFSNNSNPNGTAVPSDLDAQFALGGGTGSTAPLVAPGTFISPGNFQATGAAVPGPVTFMIVAYNGIDYVSSLIRGHSAAFTMTPKVGTEFAPFLGDGNWGGPNFQVNLVPEPSTLALAGLGLASLLFARRRK